VEKIYKLGGFAKLMSIRRSAVIKWIKQGRIKAIVIHGRRYIPASELEIPVERVYASVEKVATYTRVGENTQKGDLDR